MHRSTLHLKGAFILLAFLVSFVIGIGWFNAALSAQAGTGGTVDIQAVIANKTTVHQPISATTNGTTFRRMENSYVVTLAFLDGRDPPQRIEQKVNAAFFHTVTIDAPVRVTINPESARIVDVTPGVVTDPMRYLTTALLGALGVLVGMAAIIWRRRTFETAEV